MFNKIDHVGIVVKNTEEIKKVFFNLFGFEVSESLINRDEGFKSTLISKEGVTLELIEPITPDGIIAKFVEKHGLGLHHISFQVDNLDRVISLLRTKEAKLVTDEPQRVDEKSRVVFMHPHTTKGTLIELVERE